MSTRNGCAPDFRLAQRAHCLRVQVANAGGVLLLLLFLMSLPSPLSGQAASASAQKLDLTELPLEALMKIEVPKVFGASKIEQNTTEAPSSVTIITADEIKRYGHRTLAEVLQSVQGFYVTYDRNYAFLGTRGVSLGDFNSRILLLVDGHRLNNNLTDGAFLGTEFLLDVDLIDRVEIIRGPGSVLYGNNAFFGVINVITRRGAQLDGAEVSNDYGSFDTLKVRGTYGKQFTNGLQMLFSGSYYESDGQDSLFYPEFNTPAQNNGVAEGLDGDTYGSVFGSIRYQDFTLQGGYISREKVNPTAQYLSTFNDPRLLTLDERSYVELKYAHRFDGDLDVMTRAYYDRNEFEIGYPVGSPTAQSFFQEQQSGAWWGAEVQLNKRLWERHTLTVGAEYRDDVRQELRLYDPDAGQVYTDINRDRQSHGVYAQGNFSVLTNLHFNGGIRYDQYEDFDPAFNPRLALIYHPFESSSLKALYGTAFRAPNFLELSDPRFQAIEPEEITSYELVYEQEVGRNLRTSVAGFINEMDDLIVLANGAFTNFDARTKGIELAMQGFWTNGIRTRLSYSFQDTENRTTDRGLPDSPAHLVKFNVSVPVWRDKVFAGVEYLYTSRRNTYYTTTTGATLPGSDAAGYGVVNLTLFSQNLVRNLEFSASVYNLFDCDYSDPATRFHQQDTLARDGRTFRLKLSYRF